MSEEKKQELKKYQKQRYQEAKESRNSLSVCQIVSLSKYMDLIVNTFSRLFIINIRFSLIISVTIRFAIF